MKLLSALHNFLLGNKLGQKKSIAFDALGFFNVSAFRFLGIVLLCALVGGCTITVPVQDNLNADDNITTQSLSASQPQKFFSELTFEDWNYAKVALSTALDPVGTGEKAFWASPKSGIRGDFVAVGKPYLNDDLICRKFNATLSYLGQDDTIAGAACRFGNGQWATYDVTAR